MRVRIKTVGEQWSDILQDFVEMKVKAQGVEFEGYEQDVFVKMARRYIKQLDLPIRVTVFCGVVRFERTDM